MILKLLNIALKKRAGVGKRGNLPSEGIRSILIIEMTRLGDVLAMLPALQLVQEHFPSARIHLLVDEQYVGLLRALELDIEVHGIRDSSHALSYLAGLLRLRRQKFDLVCSMSPTKRNVGLALTMQADRRVGYLTYSDSDIHYLTTSPVEGSGVQLERTIVYGREHIERRALKVCEALNVSLNSTHEHLRLRREIHQTVRNQLVKEGILPVNPYVVIHPFAGWEYKRWQIGNFCRLVESIVEKLQYDAVFVSAKEDAGKLDVARNLLQDKKGVHYFPSSSLVDTAVLIGESSLFVGNDSGPSHLAASLGIKVIGLYGPAPPELTAPRTTSGTFFYKQVECSPCDQVSCVRPDDHCMAMITSDEVYAAVVSMLAEYMVTSG